MCFLRQILFSGAIMLLLGLVNPCYCQSFDPFEGKTELFQARLTRYFKDSSEERTKRTEKLEAINHFVKDSLWSLKNASERLERYQQLISGLQLHSKYWRLVSLRNRKSTMADSAGRDIDNAISLLNRFVDNRLSLPVFQKYTPGTLQQYRLDKYAYFLQREQEKAAHQLTPEEQKITTLIADPLWDGLIARYGDIMDGLSAAPVQASSGKALDPVRDRALLLKDTAAAVRQSAMKKYAEAYDAHKETVANLLIDLVRLETGLARGRHFSSAPAAVYKRSLQLSETDVKLMLQEMHAQTGIVQTYQKWQKSYAGTRLNLDNAHSWDIQRAWDYTPSQKTFAEARTTILAALEPLGKQYMDSLSWLIDPANGALDLLDAPGRATENTSLGYPGVPTTVFMKAFRGTHADISRLAHELGHGVHQQLINGNKVPPCYTSGPAFVSEGTAMLNELLLLDYLTAQSKNAQQKAYYTYLFLQKLSFELFTSASEADFEQQLYEGVSSGRITDARGIDSIYSEVMVTYDLFFPQEPERRNEWMRKRLLFDDPLYNVNYLYGMLLTCQLYEQVKTGNFSERYLALLKNGFPEEASGMLEKNMGVRLSGKALLDKAIHLMQSKLKELELLSKE